MGDPITHDCRADLAIYSPPIGPYVYIRVLGKARGGEREREREQERGKERERQAAAAQTVGYIGECDQEQGEMKCPQKQVGQKLATRIRGFGVRRRACVEQNPSPEIGPYVL